MKLKYMQKLKDNPNLIGESWAVNKGLSKEDTLVLSDKFNGGKEFPLVFNEFLALAGESNGLDIVAISDDFEQLREDCEESLEYTGYKMDRPYFVFDQLDGQYSIFFLDEDMEDPDVYILFPTGAYGSGEPLLRNVKYTFSKMINDAIYRRLNNIPL
ncbi:hypothetical protein [Tenacibaculum maritimum]|uniref:hypothetical protein n=2 Tax=Tenacibaculum maritimum TaxID=107401 RepID=UPI0012E4BB90|nr:hypothetical protein [Tenacibaculum maritimum]MCD9583238.1 hypothetical protein [Tenacibaculum maritimum]MCD9636259.1 hypothetical protein [Tenacibaculum maritimum]CAA0155680.1 conserved hypothetical protein [Tenacibaculum maritimum]CAA0242397.1 conserved hypothetical protein [Tenacibaculum maritimum]